MMYWYIIGLVVVFVLYNLISGRFADYRKKFTDKIIVIVGASSGIGEELALQISQYRPKGLVLVARRLDKIQDIKKRCEDSGAASVYCVKADVAIPNDCERIIQEAIQKYEKIDVLFLNAGIGFTSSLFKLKDPSILQQVINVDLMGAIYPAFYALPHLRKSAGHIVVTSSAFGKMPGVGLSAYSCAKHGLHGFFDCLRAEETRNRIKVTIVCPGYIKTPIHDRSLDNEGKEIGSHKKTAHFALTETSVRQAVRKILQGTAANKSEVLFPSLVSLSAFVRGLLGPAIFDWLLYGSKN